MPIITASTVWFCTICGADCGFEQPPCVDEHGTDCPDWVCVDCGFAIVVGAGRQGEAALVVPAGRNAA